MNKLLVCILLIASFLLAPITILAQESEEKLENVNSYELFWPMTAGKVRGDSLYSLKLFKENLRSALIFGKAEKADYAMFLATKRLLEAEKLLGDEKKDIAGVSLDESMKNLSKAEKYINEAGDSVNSTVNDLNNKFDNFETFLPWLITKNEGSKEKLQQILDKTKELHSKI